MVALAMSVAFAVTGAASPEALTSELSEALNGGAPWKIVDYVLPEDRPPVAASFDMMAAFASMDENTKVRIDAIHVKYGVLEIDAPSAGLTLEQQLARPYVNVTDFHGLCEDLWAVLSETGEATGEPTLPKLVGSKKKPAIKIGKQKLPLAEVSGRWFIDAPAPE